METEVIMERAFLDGTVRQKSKTEFICANDIVQAGNKYRVNNGMSLFHLSRWMDYDATKEFITALEEKYGTVKAATRGRKGITWVHPYLAIDLALAISPELKIEVYSWLFDNLLKYRNDSGDSYKKLCGSVWNAIPNKSEMKTSMNVIAASIRLECGVTDWQKATVEQLALRDKMHENISLLCDVIRDIDKAVEYGIKNAKDNFKRAIKTAIENKENT
jgi:hypothetical protein